MCTLLDVLPETMHCNSFKIWISNSVYCFYQSGLKNFETLMKIKTNCWLHITQVPWEILDIQGIIIPMVAIMSKISV